jgi:carbohydrate kinase (thermoresistant glucokinase family)
MVWIVMGVSGSGKTTVGKLLAKKLDLPFYDADDFHPKQNVQKMEAGEPLTDQDREPWLNHLSEMITRWNSNSGAVLACSALKESYRLTLKAGDNNVQFVFLDGDIDLIRKRMKSRKGHYMPSSLLESQFEALEMPSNAIRVSIDQPPANIVKEILEASGRD